MSRRNNISTSRRSCSKSRAMRMVKNHRHRGSGRHPLLSLSSGLAALLVFLSRSIIMRTNAFLQYRFVVPIYKTTTTTTTTTKSISATIINSSRSSSSSGNNDENADLLEKARSLREEASLIEDDLRAAQRPHLISATAKRVLVAPLVVNTQLEEWVDNMDTVLPIL